MHELSAQKALIKERLFDHYGLELDDSSVENLLDEVIQKEDSCVLIVIISGDDHISLYPIYCETTDLTFSDYLKLVRFVRSHHEDDPDLSILDGWGFVKNRYASSALVTRIISEVKTSLTLNETMLFKDHIARRRSVSALFRSVNNIKIMGMMFEMTDYDSVSYLGAQPLLFTKEI